MYDSFVNKVSILERPTSLDVVPFELLSFDQAYLTLSTESVKESLIEPSDATSFDGVSYFTCFYVPQGHREQPDKCDLNFSACHERSNAVRSSRRTISRAIRTRRGSRSRIRSTRHDVRARTNWRLRFFIKRILIYRWFYIRRGDRVRPSPNFVESTWRASSLVGGIVMYHSFYWRRLTMRLYTATENCRFSTIFACSRPQTIIRFGSPRKAPLTQQTAAAGTFHRK